LNISSASQGINYSVYEGKWSKLPDFSTLHAVHSGSVSGIDISMKKGKDEYGYVFDGLVKIPEEGIYTFYISSDDGSRLVIDNKMLIDNDGLHGMGEKSKEAPLAKGYHKFKVLFFENSGEDDLQVLWKGPGFEKTAIPASALFKE
jgi:alpha-L-fucosidase